MENSNHQQPSPSHSSQGSVSSVHGQPVSVIVPNTCIYTLPSKDYFPVNNLYKSSSKVSTVRSLAASASPLPPGAEISAVSASVSKVKPLLLRDQLAGSNVTSSQILGLKPLSEETSASSSLVYTNQTKVVSQLSSLQTPKDQGMSTSETITVPQSYSGTDVQQYPVTVMLSGGDDSANLPMPFIQVIVVNNNNGVNVQTDQTDTQGLCRIAPAPSVGPIRTSSRSSVSMTTCEETGGRHRPYTCSFQGCLKSYIKSSHLKAHFRIHTGKLS